jgi:hypothetical protein
MKRDSGTHASRGQCFGHGVDRLIAYGDKDACREAGQI